MGPIVTKGIQKCIVFSVCRSPVVCMYSLVVIYREPIVCVCVCIACIGQLYNNRLWLCGQKLLCTIMEDNK